MKRIIDVVISTLGLVLFMPILLVSAVAVKMGSEGPVLYRGMRLGKNGRPFGMLKFRTMIRHAEKLGTLATPDGDPRVTNAGKVLRQYKLDELPQLINVLKGDMSIVGPRPEASFYFRYYSAEEKWEILSVRPGITDYGSLRFHDEGKLLAGAEDPVKLYLETIRGEKVKEQLRYIREQSLLVDIKVILATIATIIATRFMQGRLVNPSGFKKASPGDLQA